MQPNKCLQPTGPRVASYTGVVPSGHRTQLPWGGLGGRVPAAEAQVRYAADAILLFSRHVVAHTFARFSQLVARYPAISALRR